MDRKLWKQKKINHIASIIREHNPYGALYLGVINGPAQDDGKVARQRGAVAF